MKKLDLVITLTLAILLLASFVDAQRTSRLTRPCPATATPAKVEVESDGDINITPCSGRAISTGSGAVLNVYDPAYATPTLSPATSRFTVGSTSYQTVPAANHFIGSDLHNRITVQNTSSKYFVGELQQLILGGTPATNSSVIGHWVNVASTWTPANRLNEAYGVFANLDIGANGGADWMVGGRFRSHVGSINVGAVTTLAGVVALADYGYAATVTDTIGVQATGAAVSNFGGTTTNFKLFHAYKGITNSDATNLFGLYVGNYLGGTGTITNNYGIFLDSTIDVGTNRFAIYSQSVAPSLLSGKLNFDATYTAAGTTGNQTINKPAFSVNFAAAASSLTVTNSFITAASVLLCTVQKNDSTLKSVSAVAAAGSVGLFGNAAATAETKVYCEVKN